MTVYEEPPIVDLDEILDESDDEETRSTALQWVLIGAGGVVGIAGLLTVLVVSAPAFLDLATWINSIQRAVTGTP